MFNEAESPRFQKSLSPSDNMGLDSKLDFIISVLMDKISIQNILEWLDERTEGVFIVEIAARRLNLSRGHVAAIYSILFLIYMFIGRGINFIYSGIGFIYPVFKSHKVLLIHNKLLESQKATAFNGIKNENHSQIILCANEVQMEIVFWVRYWIVYSLISFISVFAYPLFSWLPLISFTRVAFIIYLYHPYTKGANTVYYLIISPLLNKNQLIIERVVNAIECGYK